MLTQRLIFGTCIALGVIGTVVADAYFASHPWVWIVGGVDVGRWISEGALSTGLILLLTVLLTRELLSLAQAHGYHPLRFTTHLFAIGLVIGPYISFNLRETAQWHDESWAGFWLAIALGFAFWMQAARRGVKDVMMNIATTMFIMFYTGGLAGYMTKLRMEVGGSEGAVLLLFSVFVVKITDVGAYFTGMAFGRHKMIPWLSPKKTWEGLAGGVATAIICSYAVGRTLTACGLIEHYAPFFSTGWAPLVFGLVMAAFSIAGDLAGSLLKRDAAVKDSSHLIPGMGGMLDILDSPLLSAPAAWFIWTRVAVFFV